MARIRTIKPDFFSSEDITLLTPLARLFYVSLWCESDRRGRFEYKPGTLKNRYFPADKLDVSRLMDNLVEAGLVRLYQPDGFPVLGWIPSFEKHQVINNREGDSLLPEFSSDDEARVPHASARVKAEGRKEGRERKEGKEGKGNDASKDASSSGDILTFGENEKVRLTQDQYSNLLDRVPDLNQRIAKLDEYMATNPKYKRENHHIILRDGGWVHRSLEEDRQRTAKLNGHAVDAKTVAEIFGGAS